MKKNKRGMAVLLLVLLAGALVLLSSCARSAEDVEPAEDPVSYAVYTVTFDLGSETFAVTTQPASGTVQRPKTPVRAGYSFAGWYDTSEYTTQFDFNKIIECDRTVFAKWEKNKNKIHFEGNGSTAGTMADMEAESESVVKLRKNEFTRIGYSFAGWSDTAAGSVKNTDGGWYYMEVTPAVTLYACWRADTYAVRLDLQGGSSAVSSVTATYDAYLPETAVPEKPAFVFAGFFTETDGRGEQYYNASMRGCRKYCLTGETTLYAYWAAAGNLLEFDGNGSTEGATASIETQTAAEVTLPPCNYLRRGYVFDGWNTRADGRGETYAAGDSFVIPASEASVVLYAQWSPNRYYVVFNDGVRGETVSTPYFYDTEDTLRPNPFIRYGYTFVAWNNSKNGDGIFYENEQNILNLCIDPDGEAVLYAVWAPVTVTVNLNKTGGGGGTSTLRVTFDAYFPQAIAPAKAGYTFAGYYALPEGRGTYYLDPAMTPVSVSDIGENGTEAYAYWIAKANILRLEPNGGREEPKEIETVTGGSVSLPHYTFTRTGYAFAGWNTEADGSGEAYAADGAYTIPASNFVVRLYAVWSANSVLIEFYGNGHTSGTTGSVNGVSDGKILLPDCGFRKEGYAFIGWSETADDRTIYPAQAQYTVTAADRESMGFYARWSLQTYTITYRLDGGTNSAYNPGEYTYESGTIVLAAPSRPGFRFDGWLEGSGVPAFSTGDRNFTACWSVITYAIHYVLNGGSDAGTGNPSSYTVLTPTIILNNPSKSGSVFEGWSEGNSIEAGSIGDKTFTAQWSGIMYSIAYILEGGQNGAGNPGSYMEDTPTITLKDPVWTGYRFVGWTCPELRITAPVTPATIPTGSGSNLTFTAHWELISYKINYIMNGGTNSDLNPVKYSVLDEDILLEDPARFGYVFDGWQEGGLIEHGSDGDKTFTAMWTPVSYNINIFDGLTETPNIVTYSIESEMIRITVGVAIGDSVSFTIEKGGTVETFYLEHRGYRLTGWYEGADDTTAVSPFIIAAGTMGDRFLVAKWETITYTITYDLGDADAVNAAGNPFTYTVEDADIILAAPTREGYTFEYWEDESQIKVEQIPSGSIGDKVLKAKWKAVLPPDPIDPPDPTEPTDPIDPTEPTDPTKSAYEKVR